MRQRASIARALVHDPAIVLLDEPFTGLDPTAAGMLRSMLLDLVARERTLVLVTHDIRQGLELCERWMLMKRGRRVEEGTSHGIDPAAFEREWFA
jgi:heme exporter protein A